MGANVDAREGVERVARGMVANFSRVGAGRPVGSVTTKVEWEKVTWDLTIFVGLENSAYVTGHHCYTRPCSGLRG